jgi:hypothetical protein
MIVPRFRDPHPNIWRHTRPSIAQNRGYLQIVLQEVKNKKDVLTPFFQTMITLHQWLRVLYHEIVNSAQHSLWLLAPEIWQIFLLSQIVELQLKDAFYFSGKFIAPVEPLYK